MDIKKMMAALAVAGMATGGFAVESSNIVGYQTSDYTVNGGSTVALSTFDKVGGGLSLTDLKVVGGTYTDNIAQFLKPNGSTAKYTYSDEDYADLVEYYGTFNKQVAARLFYINEDDAVGMECTAGWYMADDGDCIVNVSASEAFKVEFGNGFFYQPMNSSAQLQYAGEVVKGDSELDLPVNGGSTLTGNCSPVDYDLGYFRVSGGTYTDNILQFLKPNGSTAKYTYSDEDYANLVEYYGTFNKQVAARLFYINATDAVGMECTPGWYMADDGDCIVNVTTQFTIKAGEGFFYQPMNAAAKLVVPSPVD